MPNRLAQSSEFQTEYILWLCPVGKQISRDRPADRFSNNWSGWAGMQLRQWLEGNYACLPILGKGFLKLEKPKGFLSDPKSLDYKCPIHHRALAYECASLHDTILLKREKNIKNPKWTIWVAQPWHQIKDRCIGNVGFGLPLPSGDIAPAELWENCDAYREVPVFAVRQALWRTPSGECTGSDVEDFASGRDSSRSSRSRHSRNTYHSRGSTNSRQPASRRWSSRQSNPRAPRSSYQSRAPRSSYQSAGWRVSPSSRSNPSRSFDSLSTISRA
jgi:hypothetical protein